ncbi:SRPBCC family protein [Myroides guanonis]|uniref:Uncharacterized conserved protein YndB, AHSA1/START domain n=1 Tax=Myroides guanonis TaxID=1150112 RepID=A0A1I3QQE1_9FLAO|nr:SRPBCC family protein [Myroides guanonis]SFJ36298.1 Uncharacterized conserved protein YndB, AHSA1/START domain [Myroides guanonis]
MEQKERITVEVQVNAPVEQVWKYWNTPNDIIQWNSADPSWHSPSSENDLRVGGKFKHRMEAKDGSFGFDFEGVYDKIIPNREITYTMGDGRRSTTLFTEKEGVTHVETTFDAESENPVEFQKQGWQAILNSFVRYAEASK